MSRKPRGWFVTGTDTEVGKTWVAEALLRGLGAAGSVVGMKPVATGCRTTPAGLRSEDAERLLAASTVPVDYSEVNPYAFEPPIAPHLAAVRAGVEMRPDVVLRGFERLAARADWVVVEGVGGWRVPFSRTLYVSDIARTLGLPAILVVGVRLGCINHALLTAAAIRADGVPLAGWVANCIDPGFDSRDESIAALAERLDAPCLDVVAFQPPGDRARVGAQLRDRLLERSA